MVMVLMQEGTEEVDPNAEWAEYMYNVWQVLGEAEEQLDRAELWK